MVDRSDILEAAKRLKAAGLGSMSPHTYLRYVDIYAKFRFYREHNGTTAAVEITAESCYCCERLVWEIIRLQKNGNCF